MDAATWLDSYPATVTAIQGLIDNCVLRNQLSRTASLTKGRARMARGPQCRSSASYPWGRSSPRWITSRRRNDFPWPLNSPPTPANESGPTFEPSREEFENDSRVNQAGLVTRVHAYGTVGPLPEGAADYTRTCYGYGYGYGEELGFGDRWCAAKQLRRRKRLDVAGHDVGGGDRIEVTQQVVAEAAGWCRLDGGAPCQRDCACVVRAGERDLGDTWGRAVIVR